MRNFVSFALQVLEAYTACVAKQDALNAGTSGDNGDRVGTKIILTSSFAGGPRHMQLWFQDAMAIVRKKGKPSFFNTFTCNPTLTWPEIIRSGSFSAVKIRKTGEGLRHIGTWPLMSTICLDTAMPQVVVLAAMAPALTARS